MKILLDLDDTVIIHDHICHDYWAFKDMVVERGYDVTLWTLSHDGQAFADLMGFRYLSKDYTHEPEADVLIDDSHELYKGMCHVKKSYQSIHEFLEDNL